MNIVFFGTPPSIKPILDSVIKNHRIIGIVSKKVPKKTKRRKFKESELKRFSNEKNIPYFDPTKIDESFSSELRKLNPDIFLVCAFGSILPEKIINIPKFGSVNIHPSLLPKYRGPSPIQSSILNLDKESGYSIIKMDKGIDTGDILYRSRPIKLNKNEKYEDLLNILLYESSKGINSAIENLVKNQNIKKQEDKQASYTKIIKKHEGHIDWQDSAEKIEAKFRAFYSWPQVYSFHNNKRFKILDMKVTDYLSEFSGKISKLKSSILVDTKTTKIIINKIQFDGKNPIDALPYFGNFDLSKINL